MRRNNLWITALAFGLSLSAYGQQAEGGISSGMLQEIKQAYKGTPADKAIHNAIAGNDINKLAINNDSKNNFDTYFSHKVNSKGITNQKSSGRCWLFTGLNVIRAQVIAKYNLPEFELSQNYNFFWDQLEKANLFLQGIIDTREKPINDKMVEWLFKNPIGDGGQFTGISDNLMKYGIVPSGVMVETYSSDNTSRMSNLIGLKLKEYGLELRDAKGSKPEALAKRKTEMLGEIYRMLVLNLGEPPTKFTWTRKDASGKPVETKEYTPQSFYQEFVGEDLKNNYVMLMNDPSRDYYKLYEIDFDRLYEEGYRGVIFDIDNTLVPHGAPADERACALFAHLKELGYHCMLLSNNKEPRVKMFNDAVQVSYIYKAGKPNPANYRKAMEQMGTDEKNTLFVGDQIFTDVYGANRTGIRTILVKPIHPKEEIQIVLKRYLEKIVLFFYRRKCQKQQSAAQKR